MKVIFRKSKNRTNYIVAGINQVSPDKKWAEPKKLSKIGNICKWNKSSAINANSGWRTYERGQIRPFLSLIIIIFFCIFFSLDRFHMLHILLSIHGKKLVLNKRERNEHMYILYDVLCYKQKTRVLGSVVLLGWASLYIDIHIHTDKYIYIYMDI